MNNPRVPITIYAPQTTARLDYVLHWIFTGRLGVSWRLTADMQEAEASAYCITYGARLPDKPAIPCSGLLFEQSIHAQPVRGGMWNSLYTLFQHDGPYTIPFDLFGAVFFLLTRYEEYTEPATDKHGRFPAGNSVLAVDGVLERPVVDEWVAYLRQMLEQTWRLSVPAKPFTLLPTYDIDIAWSYRHKGALRWMGAGLKELLQGNARSLFSRVRVMAGVAPDPYDAYDWMETVHRQHRLSPRYFILAALQRGPYDKNIHPEHPAMQQLIRDLERQGPVGMHPSYDTDRSPARFAAEKAMLEKIITAPIHTSRQHFIRLFVPATYRALIAGGITDDYSMGYGTALGFRAGTSHSFYWYDLEREAQTALRVHPFCFMDTTAHFDLSLDVREAFQRLDELKKRLEKCGGVLTTVFHNFSLGSEPEWDGWKEGYAAFLQSLPRETDPGTV